MKTLFSLGNSLVGSIKWANGFIARCLISNSGQRGSLFQLEDNHELHDIGSNAIQHMVTSQVLTKAHFWLTFEGTIRNFDTEHL